MDEDGTQNVEEFKIIISERKSRQRKEPMKSKEGKMSACECCPGAIQEKDKEPHAINTVA